MITRQVLINKEGVWAGHWMDTCSSWGKSTELTCRQLIKMKKSDLTKQRVINTHKPLQSDIVSHMLGHTDTAKTIHGERHQVKDLLALGMSPGELSTLWKYSVMTPGMKVNHWLCAAQCGKHAATHCKLFVSRKVYFSGGASAKGHCQENMKQIAEHAYFICLTGLVWSGWRSKSGFVSSINTHIHTHACTDTLKHTWLTALLWSECTGGSERQREWAEGRENAGCRDRKTRKTKTVRLWDLTGRVETNSWYHDDLSGDRTYRGMKMNNNHENALDNNSFTLPTLAVHLK